MSDTSVHARIGFDVNSRVTQDVTIIKDGVTPDELVTGLKAGQYYTTVGYKDPFSDDNPGAEPFPSVIIEFDQEGNEVPVAVIAEQCVDTSDREAEASRYSNYALLHVVNDEELPF